MLTLETAKLKPEIEKKMKNEKNHGTWENQIEKYWSDRTSTIVSTLNHGYEKGGDPLNYLGDFCLKFLQLLCYYTPGYIYSTTIYKVYGELVTE